jgi:hypothetical protein
MSTSRNTRQKRQPQQRRSNRDKVEVGEFLVTQRGDEDFAGAEPTPTDEAQNWDASWISRSPAGIGCNKQTCRVGSFLCSRYDDSLRDFLRHRPPASCCFCAYQASGQHVGSAGASVGVQRAPCDLTIGRTGATCIGFVLCLAYVLIFPSWGRGTHANCGDYAVQHTRLRIRTESYGKRCQTQP